MTLTRKKPEIAHKNTYGTTLIWSTKPSSYGYVCRWPKLILFDPVKLFPFNSLSSTNIFRSRAPEGGQLGNRYKTYEIRDNSGSPIFTLSFPIHNASFVFRKTPCIVNLPLHCHFKQAVRFEVPNHCFSEHWLVVTLLAVSLFLTRPLLSCRVYFYPKPKVDDKRQIW